MDRPLRGDGAWYSGWRGGWFGVEAVAGMVLVREGGKGKAMALLGTIA